MDDPYHKPVDHTNDIHDMKTRIALLEQSQVNMKEELGKISNNLSKLVWLVLSAIILAVINTLLKSGGGV